MINVLIADDHQMVLDGLKLLLKKEKNINVVGEANNGSQVLDLLKNNSVDIAILDVEMPKKDGIATAKEILQSHGETKVLILTMYNHKPFIKQLIEIGVYGYILKNKGSEELVEAINEIASGNFYFGKEVTNALIAEIKNEAIKSKTPQVKLTKREVEVLKLIADGKSTPQIAEKLFIADSVETHRRNLIDKTGVENSKRLIKWAIENDYSD